MWESWGRLGIYIEFWSKSLRRKDKLGNSDTDENILKWILKKQDTRMQTEFI
jgi:hypothetical protein